MASTDPAAQKPARPARIGYLITAARDAPEAQPIITAFHQGLRERGLVEGSDYVIEYRSAAGRIERFPGLVAELLALPVDVLVAQNSLSGRAAQQATASIPIVVAVMSDPVGDGFAASLPRPGRNVTGLTFLGPELVPRRLALLKDLLPAATRIALLWHPAAQRQATVDDMMRQTEIAAKSLGVELRRHTVSHPGDIDAALAAMTAQRAEAVLVMPSPLLFNERRRIVELARRHRLPLAGNAREFAEAGALMSYGANLPDMSRRAAAYVARILAGANPGELPIEQPTQWEMVINLATARALGITVPQSLLLRADEVIR